MDITNKLDDNDLNAHQNNYKELYAGMSNAQAAKVILDNFLNGSGVVSRIMIENNAINETKIADGSVTHVKIGQLAVDGSNIYPNAVTPSKIADNAIGSRHILDTVVSRGKLSGKFLFNRRVENNESIDTVFNDGTYIITSGNSGTFPDGTNRTHNWVMSVEVISNVWVYQTLYRLELPNERFTRVILTTTPTLYQWHKHSIGANSVKQENLDSESVSREKLSKNFLFTKRVENTEPIEKIVNDGTYIITAGNSGNFPDGENKNLNWVMTVEVVNTHWVYQTINRLEQPQIRYTRVINNLNGTVYQWHKHNFGGNEGEGGNEPTPDLNRVPHKKMLMIGNSFSLNATEYVNRMCDEQNIDVTIGILYRAGESLENHYNNALSDDTVYTYYERTSRSGVVNTTTHTNYSFSGALDRHNWDIVTFQQNSSNSNKYETFQPYLNNLKSIVENVLGANVTNGVLQTWALSKTVNPNQEQAFQDIVNAYDDAAYDADLGLILPTGAAIQSARTNLKLQSVDNELTEDGSHLSELGKYIASMTVFQSLYKGYSDVQQIDLNIGDITDYQKSISRNAATNAIINHKIVVEL